MPASPSSPTLIRTVAELREQVHAARQAGRRIGCVPTMGALHAGHLSLVAYSQRECDVTVATIFVNPTQFAPGEDLEKYPRELESDVQKLAAAEAAIVFAPEPDEVYPPDYCTYVEVEGLSRVLEGEHRPTHFRGVTTVVAKLFNMVLPDAAYFGQKDYQQAVLIRRMAADLNFPVEVRVCPIVREPDGLAMSSRNVYLKQEERPQALTLSRSLQTAVQRFAEGERDAQNILAEMQAVFSEFPQVDLNYVTLADPNRLQQVSRVDENTIALVAARVGAARLIDNTRLGDGMEPFANTAPV